MARTGIVAGQAIAAAFEIDPPVPVIGPLVRLAFELFGCTSDRRAVTVRSQSALTAAQLLREHAYVSVGLHGAFSWALALAIPAKASTVIRALMEETRIVQREKLHVGIVVIGG